MSKSVFFFLLILLGTAHSKAQSLNGIERFRIGLEFGKLYINVLDVNTNCDGFGPITFSEIDGKLFHDPLATSQSLYGSLKFFFPNNLIIQSSLLNFTSGNRALSYPQVGLKGINYTIFNLGCGYHFPIKKLHISIIGNIAYSYIGWETYIIAYRPNPQWIESVEAWINHSDPWGISIMGDVQYQITSHIGLGSNLGFYYFPFEKATLKGNNVERFYPELVANTKPIKQLLIASFYLSYSFSIRSHKK